MTPKAKLSAIPLKSIISPNEDYGIEILTRSAIPTPTGRGRLALVPQLTIAKTLKLTSSFAAYVRKQLEEFKLTDKVEIVRREGGKKLYLTGPAADNA